MAKWKCNRRPAKCTTFVHTVRGEPGNDEKRTITLNDLKNVTTVPMSESEKLRFERRSARLHSAVDRKNAAVAFGRKINTIGCGITDVYRA